MFQPTSPTEPPPVSVLRNQFLRKPAQFIPFQKKEVWVPSEITGSLDTELKQVDTQRDFIVANLLRYQQAETLLEKELENRNKIPLPVPIPYFSKKAKDTTESIDESGTESDSVTTESIDESDTESETLDESDEAAAEPKAAKTKPVKKDKKVRAKKQKMKQIVDYLDKQSISEWSKRVPQMNQFKIPISTFYLNNRKVMLQKWTAYWKHIVQNQKKDANMPPEAMELMEHQQMVRQYLNLYTPYRGLLIYHGLGVGKTCTSIAVAEAMKYQKPIIVMTKASLQTSFYTELKKCGDPLFRLSQHWESIPVKKSRKGDKENEKEEENKKIFSQLLNIPLDWIEKKKHVWLMKPNAEPNFDKLSQTQQQEIQDQLNEMVRNKYTFINYNGSNFYKEVAQLEPNPLLNPFEGKVIIIDEAHNFCQLIMNKLLEKEEQSQKKQKAAAAAKALDAPKKKMDALDIYEALKSTQDARLVFLSGTPIINEPYELSVMFNMLRGYITSWEIKLNPDPSQGLVSETKIKEYLQNQPLLDYLQYNANTKLLTVTRNPYGFVRSNKGGVFKSDEQGNLSDDMFINQLMDALVDKRLIQKPYRKHDIVKKKQYNALPTTSIQFNEEYIDSNQKAQSTIKDKPKFQKRILGLTSYFKSTQESLLAKLIVPETDPSKSYHLVKVEMSPHQFNTYQNIRSEEMQNIRKQVKRKIMGHTETVINSYRIYSRLACNFAFPSEITRPRKNFGKVGGGSTTLNWLEDSDYTVVETVTNGDCFFDALEKALKKTTIEKLRKILAKSLTEEQFQFRKDLNQMEDMSLRAETVGVLDMSKFKNLKQFQKFILTKEFWADSWAISALEQALKVKIIVLSEENIDTEEFISCGETMGDGDFQPKHYILLTHSGNHYRLVSYKGSELLVFAKLPDIIKKTVVRTCMTKDNGPFYRIPEFRNWKNENEPASDMEKNEDEDNDEEGKDKDEEGKDKEEEKDETNEEEEKVEVEEVEEKEQKGKKQKKADPKQTKLFQDAQSMGLQHLLEEGDDDDEEDDAIGKAKKMNKEYKNDIIASLKQIKERSETLLVEPYLSQCSVKFAKILKNIQDDENVGKHLVYSNFREVEGITLFQFVLEANGFAPMRIFKDPKTKEWKILNLENIRNKPRFILYTGTADKKEKEEKEMLLNIYNGNWDLLPESLVQSLKTLEKTSISQENNTHNIYGDVIRVIMITQSGAEGINMKNTRFVHLMEPFWHMVRLEQVIGRARRIWSHQDLPEEYRTVKVFLYVSVYSQETLANRQQNANLFLHDLSQLEKDETNPRNFKPFTTDQILLEDAEMKLKLNNMFLTAVQETSIDCAIWKEKNNESNTCFRFQVRDNDVDALVGEP